ncbi:MAG: hypothetical protein QOE05_1377 [Actinomycetota bacterium]|nr:hypothetical protein [Actinomycetota bacterium]
MAAANRPRTPSIVLGSVVVALSVLVAAVALTSRAQTPPSVAEFAPQPVQQIKKALDEQPEEVPDKGLGAGSNASPPPRPTSGPGASPLPSPPTLVVPRIRQCVGNPPRQTEDPQSPPCVAYSDPKLDNGGATSKGVTRDSISVAIPQQFLEDLSIAPKLASFFNKRYEFYGRKITLTSYQPSGCASGSQPDPAKMRDDAIAVDEEAQAFASLAYCNANGADHHYYDALAQRRIISVTDGNLTTGVESHYAAHAPYEWNVQPGVETMLANTAQFICGTLAGRAPRYAGAAQARAATRKFGLIYTRAVDGTVPDVRPLRNGLKSCGQSLFEVRDDQSSDPSRNGVNTMVSMQNAGVTSVICLCNVLDTRGVYMPAASGQGYQPEWVETTYINNDLDNAYGGGNAPPDQASHVLGVTFRNKLLPRQDMPWFWALREADPNADPGATTYYSANSRYQQLLLLASAIQLAGPKLTPQTFAAGLARARFPNPGAAGAPYYQARVGFDGGRHTMTADAAMFWYDPSRPGTIDPSSPGAICYVDHGRRYRLGEWRRSDPVFFAGSCT